MDLKSRVEAQMLNGIRAQDEIYDEIVLPAMESSDPNAMDIAMKQYREKLNHFDASSFNKVVKVLTTDVKEQDPEIFAHYSDMFTSISEYATHRNAFNEKAKEIRQMEGTPSEKQAIFDTLDRNRTQAHNRVIALFNELNDFADKRKIAQPYPNNGQPFKPSDVNDRELVANILLRQSTLLETVNQFMASEKEVESPREKMKGMTLKEQLAYGRELEFKKQCINLSENQDKLTL